jgi:hypothetical protein
MPTRKTAYNQQSDYVHQYRQGQLHSLAKHSDKRCHKRPFFNNGNMSTKCFAAFCAVIICTSTAIAFYDNAHKSTSYEDSLKNNKFELLDRKTRRKLSRQEQKVSRNILHKLRNSNDSNKAKSQPSSDNALCKYNNQTMLPTETTFSSNTNPQTASPNPITRNQLAHPAEVSVFDELGPSYLEFNKKDQKKKLLWLASKYDQEAMVPKQEDVDSFKELNKKYDVKYKTISNPTDICDEVNKTSEIGAKLSALIIQAHGGESSEFLILSDKNVVHFDQDVPNNCFDRMHNNAVTVLLSCSMGMSKNGAASRLARLTNSTVITSDVAITLNNIFINSLDPLEVRFDDASSVNGCKETTHVFTPESDYHPKYKDDLSKLILTQYNNNFTYERIYTHHFLINNISPEERYQFFLNNMQERRKAGAINFFPISFIEEFLLYHSNKMVFAHDEETLLNLNEKAKSLIFQQDFYHAKDEFLSRFWGIMKVQPHVILELSANDRKVLLSNFPCICHFFHDLLKDDFCQKEAIDFNISSCTSDEYIKDHPLALLEMPYQLRTFYLHKHPQLLTKMPEGIFGEFIYAYRKTLVDLPENLDNFSSLENFAKFIEKMNVIITVAVLCNEKFEKDPLSVDVEYCKTFA